MSAEQHGGNIYKASERCGISRFDILDFSANINPLGIPEKLKDMFISGIHYVENYPDPECNDLKEAIAGYTGAGRNNIIIGNGASEIISLLFAVLSQRRVLIPAPTFSEYQRFAESSKTQIDLFRLREQDCFKLYIKRLIEKLTSDLDVVLFCNPNNPTSTLVSSSDIEKLLMAARSKGITVIIDEAFIELTDGGDRNSAAELLKVYDNLFIIRAFTKIFAIPGVRLGYGLGNSDIISKMWSMKLPWSVNTFACLAAGYLPHAGEYLQMTQKWLVDVKSCFYNQLSGIKGIHVFEPETNFILMKITHPFLTSEKLRDEMLLEGILIRDAGNFTFLNNKYVRIAVKDRESNSRFLEAFNKVLNKINTIL